MGEEYDLRVNGLEVNLLFAVYGSKMKVWFSHAFGFY